MPRATGEQTRKKILSAAEALFSEKGYDGTGVEAVARAAGVNKALIYYHFKDKRDLFLAMFREIMNELDNHADFRSSIPDMSEKIRQEIEFCARRDKILSIMLMEALKSDSDEDVLFQCADMVLFHRIGQKDHDDKKQRLSPEQQALVVHEFFTGFMPIVSFVTLRDKFCKHYGCDPGGLMDDFMAAFERSHLASHMSTDRDDDSRA
jgi:AcrR family transcriptional regulator